MFRTHNRFAARPICFSVLAFALIAALVSNVAQAETDSRRLLIDGEVIDAVSGKAVQVFRVVPGVRYNRAPGVRGNVTVWQPHMIREMNDGVFQWPRTRGYDEMRFRIEADGYRPATTTWLGKGGPHLRMKVHMRPDPGIAGVVLGPDGTPAGGATFAVALPNRAVRLDGFSVDGNDKPMPARLSDRWRRPQTVLANDRGEFLLPFETDNAAQLCVVHQSGYFEQDFNDFTNEIADQPGPIAIQLDQWARIDGRVQWKDSPGSGAIVSAAVNRSEPYPGLIASNGMTVADSEGKYSFAYLPPGNVQLGHQVMPKIKTEIDTRFPVAAEPNTLKAKVGSGAVFQYPVQHVKLKSGQVEVVVFGGEGIDVVGQLVGILDFQAVSISIRPPAPDVWRLGRFGNQGANDLQKGYATLRSATYAPLYFRENLPVAEDGSFKIENVMTGEYNLWVHGAVGSMQFNVQSSDVQSNQDRPHDLGVIQVKAK